jgi:hypothetical protein
LYFKVERIRNGIDNINNNIDEIKTLNSIILSLPGGKGCKYNNHYPLIIMSRDSAVGIATGLIWLRIRTSGGLL